MPVMPPSPSPADPTQVANLIVMWSGVVLAGFTLLLAVFSLLVVGAGLFGLRELRSIRRAGLHAREEADRQAARAAALVEQWQEEILTIDQRLSKLVEVSYLFNQGELAYREGFYDRAVEHLGRAVTLDPRNERVRYRLARSLTNLGQEEAAAQQLREAEELGGLPPGLAKRGLALVYRYSDANQALRYAKEATEEASTEARNWNILGLMLRDAGSFDNSRVAHERAAQLDRDSVVTPFYLALLEAHARAFQRALNDSGMAMVRLEDQERLGKVKPLWAATIRWADAVLRGEYPRADDWTTVLEEKCMSKRRALEIHGHMVFLLYALERDGFLDRYAARIERRWIANGPNAT